MSRWEVHEIGSRGDGLKRRSSEDGEFKRRGVQEMESLRDVEFSRWDVQEMGSLGDGEFRRWGVHEMGIVATT